jgi:hypothetical protein
LGGDYRNGSEAWQLPVVAIPRFAAGN